MKKSLQYVLSTSHPACAAGEENNSTLHKCILSAHIYSVNANPFSLEQLSSLESFIKKNKKQRKWEVRSNLYQYVAATAANVISKCCN